MDIIKQTVLATVLGIAATAHLFAADAPAPTARDTVLIAGFDGPTLPLIPNRDGGDPPAFSLSKEKPNSGTACLKLSFRAGRPGYGNLQMPVWLSGAEEAVTLHVRRDNAKPKSTLYIWLFEDDGDAWLSPATPLEKLGEGWQKLTLKLSDFRYQPRGDKKKNRLHVNRLLIGCNYADFTAYVDNLAFAGKDIVARRKAMNSPHDPVCTVTPEQAVRPPFLGLGAQWNPYQWIDVPDEDWRKIAERVRWMRLPVARVMILSKWFVREDGSFDWDSPAMKKLYRILDHCQELGTTVLLTDWGCVRSWNRIPGVKGNDDPKYAEIIAAHVDHLINKKEYNCIKYFILVNEPNLEAGGYGVWVKGVRNVVKEFAARGLDKKVGFMGSDASQCNMSWHRNSIRDLKNVLAAYDLHMYAPAAEVRWGKIEAGWRRLWDYALKNDPAAKDKPFVIGEAGMRDGMSTGKNKNIATYRYGVFMPDYAIQSLRAGTSAVNAWMLDDNSHKTFAWGAWSNSREGLKLRPWFYTWSLLCRYLPPGSTLYRVTPVTAVKPLRSVQVRVLAAQSPKGEWTFCVVNREMIRPVRITFRIPDAPAMELRRYLYSETRRPADPRGFPLPVSTDRVEPAKGFVCSCPANSVVVLTSITHKDDGAEENAPE